MFVAYTVAVALVVMGPAPRQGRGVRYEDPALSNRVRKGGRLRRRGRVAPHIEDPADA